MTTIMEENMNELINDLKEIIPKDCPMRSYTLRTALGIKRYAKNFQKTDKNILEDFATFDKFFYGEKEKWCDEYKMYNIRDDAETVYDLTFQDLRNYFHEAYKNI